jgi:hypothetical protein
MGRQAAKHALDGFLDGKTLSAVAPSRRAP